MPISMQRGASGLFGLSEDLADVLDLGQQLVRLDGVGAAFGTRGACELGGLVEQRVELRVLLEVRGFADGDRWGSSRASG